MITSILDTDLYKFTMQKAVIETFPIDTHVVYKFKNRGKHRFTKKFTRNLRQIIKRFDDIILTEEEYDYINNIEFLSGWYAEYLRGYRFDHNEVNIRLNDDNDIEILIAGPWHKTILWEVPLMATISKLFYANDFLMSNKTSIKNTESLAHMKGHLLSYHGFKFADFGTRRRHSGLTQSTVLNGLMKYKHFVGTSNVYYAMKKNLRPIGTMAHEWIMGNSVLCGLRNANRYSLENWSKVYNGNLGIALPDTFGTEGFLKDFDLKYAKLYDGVRQDSGDPLEFADKIVAHYNNLGINTRGKTIVFSDSIKSINDIENIAYHCNNLNINYSFGIGTWFTNDFPNIKPLNMVIKLHSVDKIPVVKLSDTPGKVMGDEKAVEVAKWTYSIK